ncbi:hypothetical protein C7H19_17910 [Aphanothece hegewaldii CCALA 016]|uniref:Uncharacterized protein n=1 Tax=Aphanothece hegewaldii CCALA 016 TaxID=2107694 RepID=A0A2T1LU89_9CHRO|nr:hypothetical protein [Aphanothece hegewaldii]PSF35018.1 hypothetical protein C7H19_17910 [Aphanothece hegewaldii CCALA 016]
MNENDPNPPHLELLVPWDLPIEQKLSETDQIIISQSLNQLLAALKQSSPATALKIIEETLDRLGRIEGYPVEPTSTKTALETWEVKDFDQYFEISHIQTENTAICLVRSILVAYQTLLILNAQYHGLDPTQIELQKQGFVSYVHLLVRVFELHLEEDND